MPVSSKAAAAALALLGSAVLWSATDGLRAFTSEGARRLTVEEASVKVAPLDLIDASGTHHALGGGKVTLVEFIYTTCPTICQAAGKDFHRLRERLIETLPTGTVQMLSVSFDTANDDREALEAYGEAHGADGKVWSVVQPQSEAVAGMLKGFGVKIIPDGFGGYQHNAAIHVVDASGHLVRIVDTDDIGGAAEAVKETLQ